MILICHNNNTMVYSKDDVWYVVTNNDGQVTQQELSKKENPGYAMACITKWGMKQDCDESFLLKETKKLYKNYNQ